MKVLLLMTCLTLTQNVFSKDLLFYTSETQLLKHYEKELNADKLNLVERVSLKTFENWTRNNVKLQLKSFMSGDRKEKVSYLYTFHFDLFKAKLHYRIRCLLNYSNGDYIGVFGDTPSDSKNIYINKSLKDCHIVNMKSKMIVSIDQFLDEYGYNDGINLFKATSIDNLNQL